MVKNMLRNCASIFFTIAKIIICWASIVVQQTPQR